MTKHIAFYFLATLTVGFGVLTALTLNVTAIIGFGLALSAFSVYTIVVKDVEHSMANEMVEAKKLITELNTRLTNFENAAGFQRGTRPTR